MSEEKLNEKVETAETEVAEVEVTETVEAEEQTEKPQRRGKKRKIETTEPEKPASEWEEIEEEPKHKKEEKNDTTEMNDDDLLDFIDSTLYKEAENIREKVDVTAVEKVDTPTYISVAYPLKEVSVGSGFGMRKHPITHKNCMHNGIDLRARYEAVFSMLPGTVVSVGEDARSGKYVTIQTACYTISYCHLYKQYVAKGDWVLAGQLIAKSGNTGMSTGPHLHLTTKKDGKAINPTILLDFIRSVKEKCYSIISSNF